MLKGHNLTLAKGLLNHWAQQFYEQRRHFAVIGFANNTVEVLRKPGKATCFNGHWINAIQGGGGTPVRQAITHTGKLLQRVSRHSPYSLQTRVRLWLLTDGRFTDLPEPPKGMHDITIVDFEQQAIALGRARRLAQHWQADYLHARELLP